MKRLENSLRLIRAVPRYEAVGVELAQMVSEGRIYFDPRLQDRAQTLLSGRIALGEEAVTSSTLSLAQTLVHEHFHLHQNPFLKTLSFWSGIASGSHAMMRYEQPAYRAAFDFLEAVKSTRPDLMIEAAHEQWAIAQVFESSFGAPLV